MDDLARAIGAPVPVQFGGETVLLGKFTMRIAGVVRQSILGKRPDPRKVAAEFMEMYPEMSEQTKEKLVERAYDDAMKAKVVTDDEYDAFVQTTEGQALVVWQMLEAEQPGRYTKERVEQIMTGMMAQERVALAEAIAQASGVDWRGNSTGPDATDKAKGPTTKAGASASAS